jgi:beta-glucanase (GH16 family)
MVAAILSGACAVLAISPSVANAATPPPPRLLFADEFNGPLDSSTWAALTPWNTRYTTGELEYYDPSNVTFSDGSLHLVSEDRSVEGYSFASGILTSLPREKFSYGYFEISAKLPKGQGVWPAFWLTNDSTLEIDVFEMLGDKPGRQYMTLHKNDHTVYQSKYNGSDFSAGYHTYGVDWQPTHVRWYIDGVLRGAYEHKMPADPLYICLNTAVGGNWPGAPDKTTKFPQSYDIDYVRVFDRMPATPTPAALPAGTPTVLAQPAATPMGVLPAGPQYLVLGVIYTSGRTATES